MTSFALPSRETEAKIPVAVQRWRRNKLHVRETSGRCHLVEIVMESEEATHLWSKVLLAHFRRGSSRLDDEPPFKTLTQRATHVAR